MFFTTARRFIKALLCVCVTDMYHVLVPSDLESDQNILTLGTDFTQGLMSLTNYTCLLTSLDKQIL